MTGGRRLGYPEEEALLHRARLLGEDVPEERTFGELMELLERDEERERRFLQQLALVAYRHAVLMAKLLSGQSLPQLHEAFPFWEEAAVQSARLHHYRQMMQRLARGPGGKENT